jgi:hypothetical protein
VPRRIAVDVLTPPAIIGITPAASGVSTVSSVIGGLAIAQGRPLGWQSASSSE